jgi:hypothetical protein
MRVATAIIAALLFASGVVAQTVPQGQSSILICRVYDRSGYYRNNVYIYPGEEILGNNICHVEAAKTAEAQPAASVQPPPPPAVTPAAPAVAPVEQPVARPAASDGKRRIFVTDSMIDEQTFIARKSSRASASGQSSGSLNGSWDRNGGNVNGSAKGSFQASGSSQAAEFGFAQRGNDPRTVEVYSLIYKECSAKSSGNG